MIIVAVIMDVQYYDQVGVTRVIVLSRYAKIMSESVALIAHKE